MSATPWPDVLDLLDYWKVCPPVHIMVKAYLGGGKDEKATSTMTEDDALATLEAGIVGF